MPAKKREVVSFVTRLNPTLVRQLDAYADSIQQSRNFVIQRWLEDHFRLHHELNSHREFDRFVRENREEVIDPIEQFKLQEVQDEYELVCAAEKRGKLEGGKKKPAGK